MANHGSRNKPAGFSFHDIPSLKPPQLPVVENKVLQMKMSALEGGRAAALVKTSEQRELLEKTTGSLRAEERKSHAALVRAYRSMENLCTQLWVNQTNLYTQLCKLQNLKRESLRRRYKMEQEEMRLRRFQGDKSDTTSADRARRRRAPPTPFIVVPDASSNVANEGVDTRRSLSSARMTPVAPALSLPNDRPDSNTAPDQGAQSSPANVADQQSAPLDVNNLESRNQDQLYEELHKLLPKYLKKTEPHSAQSTSKLSLAAPLDAKKQQRSDQDSYNVYRIDENGQFVLRKGMPLSFKLNVPSNKLNYKRNRILNQEHTYLRSALERSVKFNPKLPVITVRDVQKKPEPAPVSLTLPEDILRDRMRQASFHYQTAWVPD